MLFGKGKGEDPLLLLQQGRFKEAAKILESRLQKGPQDFSTKMRLAEAYEGEGRKDDAAAIYVREADACLAGGDRSQGLALLKKAQRLLPADQRLPERIAKLEGQRETASEEEFSFDVDMSGPEDDASASPEGEVSAPIAPAIEASVAPSETSAPLQASLEEAGVAMIEPPAVPPRVEVPKEPESFAMVETAPVARPAVIGMTVPLEENFKDTDVDSVIFTFIACLFPELDASHIDILRSAGKRNRLGTGGVLLNEEEEGDSLFIVVEGHLEAKGHFSGKEILLATFGPGDIVGEVAFLKRVPRTATVTALDDALLLELPAAKLRAELEEHPDMQVQLDSILSRRVEKTLMLVKDVVLDSDGTA